MAKKAYCRKCDANHQRPVGKKCRRNAEDISSSVPLIVSEAPGPSMSGPGPSAGAGTSHAPQTTAPLSLPAAVVTTTCTTITTSSTFASGGLQMPAIGATPALDAQNAALITQLLAQLKTGAAQNQASTTSATPKSDKVAKKVRREMRKLGIDGSSEEDEPEARKTRRTRKQGSREVDIAVRKALKKAGVMASDNDSIDDDSEDSSGSDYPSQSYDSDASTGCTDSDYAENSRRKRHKKAKGRRYKSGRNCTARDTGVNPRVPWPHMGGVYKGKELASPKYQVLTISEFVEGFVGQALRPRFAKVQKQMLLHLIETMKDASNTGDWEAVLNFNGLVFEEMERKRMTWRDAAKVEKLRLRYLNWSQPDANPCPAFQTGDCKLPPTHDGLKHVCRHCLVTRKREFDHAEASCYNKYGRKVQATQQE